ncbi:hypothetical protein PInf_012152 [Phytophthora infestans]|nr:hypothetical protein PInf_012152 [Phytophthora infestans]
MAHLGGVYYQTVSAIAQSQEVMVSFPVSKRPFGRLELNESDRRRFHLQATELLGDALKEYEEFALIRHRQIDRRRWKPVKNHENIAVYRESRSYAVSRSLSIEDEKTFARAAAMAPVSSSGHRRVSRSSSSSGGSGSGSISTIRELPAHQATELELLTGWGPTATEAREHKKRSKSRSISAVGSLEQLPTLLGVGNIVGSLDDVMYGVAAQDCASMALKNACMSEDALDGDVLCAIEGPSERSPFRFLGIKWLVHSMTGTTAKHKLTSLRDLVYLEATGVITRGDGIRIGYQIMHSVNLRGCTELYDSHGVIRAKCEIVHLFVELDSRTVDVFLKSNVTPKGKVSESGALQTCANSLLYCGRSVQCSRDKKLAWLLQCNQNADKQDNNGKAARCKICNKSFGFLRQSVQCKLCSGAMCSKCAVERTLKSVDASGNKRHVAKFVSTSVIELCTSCIATNRQTSALAIAREEVVAGRFGPVPLKRGSNHSSDSANASITHVLHFNRRATRKEVIVLRKDGEVIAAIAMKLNRKLIRFLDVDMPAVVKFEPNARVTEDQNSIWKSPRACTNPRTRGLSAESHSAEDRYHERYMQREMVSGNKHKPVYGSAPVELDNSGRGSRGLPVNLSDLEDPLPYTPSKESIRRTTSSSDSSFESIQVSGISSLRSTALEPEAEKEEEEFRDTFDSFGDLIDIRDDVDDVVETLDTKDMEAVKRASQVNRNLWQQIADLRNTAENTYQYTKESTAMHMTQGGVESSHSLKVMSDDGDSRLEMFLAVVEKLEIELDDPVETAEEFQDLEELDLSEKGLTELPGDLVLALPPNLKTLALEKNGLDQLPKIFGSDAASTAAWGQLTELYLRDNELTKLPPAIGELSKLESLYLEDNKLTSDGIPNEIDQLSSTLAGLCLHRNLLTTFPVSLCQLVKLEELYLDDNALEALPEEFGMLTNLKELDILGNKLTTLPDSFKNLHKLEILHAERNQLVKLPKHLGELQALRKVYLQNNYLTKLHASLGRCMKLEVINIEDNRLAKVAKRIGDLPKLKHLLLANNNITELPFNPVEKNPSLRRLTLKGNQLSPEILELEKQVAMAKVTEEEENED